MSENLTLILHLPGDWTEKTATILAERLVEKELPPDVTVQLAYPENDGPAYGVLREWQVA